jgi:hypothetical protein
MKNLKLVLIRTIFVLFVISLFSCKTDKENCLESVKRVFPKSKIYKDPKNGYIFYVVDSTGVKKVKTTNFTNSDIDEVIWFIPVN